jgi:hypothetical protein
MFSSKIMPALYLSLLTSISTATLSANEDYTINKKRVQDIAIAGAVGLAVGIAVTTLYFHLTKDETSFTLYQGYTMSQENLDKLIDSKNFKNIRIGYRGTYDWFNR